MPLSIVTVSFLLGKSNLFGTFVITIMKYLFAICYFLFLGTAQSFAQQPHFIYLQTDNHQPFYVMVKGKNYSSAAIGYVILPKLENGDYRIKVGFAKSETGEQDYIIKVTDNDQGFMIKDFGDKGAGLFNLQTLAIQYSGEEGFKLDAVAKGKREAEKETLRLQQQKDSTEKAEALLAEQNKAASEAKIAAEMKQKEAAATLAKQQADDGIKAENEAKTTLEAKLKKEAAALAKQQVSDNLKLAKVVKSTLQAPPSKPTAAMNKQQAAAQAKVYRAYWQAKREQEKLKADSLAQQQQTVTESKAANQIAIATAEAAAAQQKRTEAAAAQQVENDADAYKKKQLATLNAQKTAAAEIGQKERDSLAVIEKNKKEVDAAIVPTDSNNDLSKQVSSASEVDKNVNANIVYQPVLVAKNANDSGTKITYHIPSNKGWDTVTAYIETPQAAKKSVETTIALPTEKATDVKFLDMHFKPDTTDKKSDMITPVFKENIPAPTEAVVNTTIETKKRPTIDAPAKTWVSETATMPTTNSNCKAVAEDKDFYALRKKMVGQNDVDEMTRLAKKSMKEKCYSTFQIRNLSALMITDADRYQFLEMAYPFVSDANNFASLSDLLKDNYYGDRFKAMLRK